MKFFYLLALITLGSLAGVKAQEADPLVLINTTDPIIPQGTGTTVRVDVYNGGATPVTSGCANVTISVPSEIATITGLGANPGGFTYQQLSPTSVRLVASGLPASSPFTDYSTAFVNVMGTAIGGPYDISAVINYVPGSACSANGNINEGNDNSTTSITVTDPLPVKLIDFTAKKEGKIVNLNWKTSEEQNSERFDVQRSADGKNWSVITSVLAKGESDNVASYAATDGNPNNGQNYYRLHMIDLDKTSAYSFIRTVLINKSDGMLFPNPVSDELTINPSEVDKLIGYKIIGANGTEVDSKTGEINGKINVKHLLPGVYMIQLKRVDGSVNTEKIVITR